MSLLLQSPTLVDVHSFYPELKFWSSMVGVAWFAFKGLQWVKEIRTQDLTEIKNGMSELKGEVKNQTNTIVTELREQRADFRSFFQPQNHRPNAV